jgi:hypothetical protein
MSHRRTAILKSKMAADQPEVTIYLLASKLDRIPISNANTVFSRMGSPMALTRMLYDAPLTGSSKSKMAAKKPEVPLSQRLNLIESRFQ